MERDWRNEKKKDQEMKTSTTCCRGPLVMKEEVLGEGIVEFRVGHVPKKRGEGVT